MRNIKLTIEYDGTNYHGWQSQKNASAVQDVVERAISNLTKEEVKLIGASRTDVGVHAYGQTANFLTQSKIPDEKFCLAINNFLPEDIVIRKSEEVPSEFHSRYSAKGKKYRYLIYNNRMRSALYRNRACHIAQELDLEKMKSAAKYFLGTHDFSAFKASGCTVKSSIRTMSHVSIERDEEIIKFEIAGDGFLYNMVRIIAGTLIYVGLGKILPEDIPVIISGMNRNKAGKTAQSHGLYLVELYY